MRCITSTRVSLAGTPLASRPCKACSWCAPSLLPSPPTASTVGPFRSPCICRLRRHTCSRASCGRGTSSRIVCVSFGLSQVDSASAFNQPLSFDTSSVKDMSSMFYVRSAACPAHAAHASAMHICTAQPCQTRIVMQPFYSAGRVGLQPASELRHVKRHRHEQHVFRALRAARACPARTLCSRLRNAHIDIHCASPSPASCPPHLAPHTHRHALRSILGRRRRSTSRRASTHPASQT